jgi:Kef-type K+ transport system membrane component KefB
VAAAALLIFGLERWHWIGRTLLALQDTTAQIRVVSTGMSLDVRSFVTSPGTLARVPVFLAAILIARGLPALLYRPLLSSRREVVTAGLLQATSLSIPIVGGSIGVGLGLIRPENYVALVAAGLVSVIAFPLIASASGGRRPGLRTRRSPRRPR